MTPKSFLLTADVHDYVLEHSEPLDDVARDLIAETAELGDVVSMQVAPEQAALLTMLTRLTGATAAIEVGTFTGYSALAIARGLPPGGTLLCLDVSEEWTAIARRYWERAGVDHHIELRLGPALESLRALPATPAYDLAFVDAHKPEYPEYIAELAPRMRTNGLILVDNTLRDGRVLPGRDEEDVDRQIQAFNRLLAGDQRFDTLLLPVADGLTFLRKR